MHINFNPTLITKITISNFYWHSSLIQCISSPPMPFTQLFTLLHIKKIPLVYLFYLPNITDFQLTFNIGYVKYAYTKYKWYREMSTMLPHFRGALNCIPNILSPLKFLVYSSKLTWCFSWITLISPSAAETNGWPLVLGKPFVAAGVLAFSATRRCFNSVSQFASVDVAVFTLVLVVVVVVTWSDIDKWPMMALVALRSRFW